MYIFLATVQVKKIQVIFPHINERISGLKATKKFKVFMLIAPKTILTHRLL